MGLAATWISAKLAIKYKILDDPAVRPDKKQKEPVPFLGGVGFTLVSIVLMSVLWLMNKYNIFDAFNLLNQNLYYTFHLFWILFAIVILLVGGIIDDKFALSSKWLFLYINIGVFIAVVGGGLKIEAFSYPFNLILPTIGFLPQILAYIWLIGCIAATKFLDGHDGLVGSIGMISLLSIASISLFDNVNQPLIFLFALIWICGIISFLVFNFPDAKLYLGESGSEIVGFVIGVLSILSGAKVATSATVIGWFILDTALVIILRFANKKPLFKADRTHWHHRLIDLGLNKIQVLVITSGILLITAHTGLLLPTQYKAYVVGLQFLALLVIILLTGLVQRKKAG